MSYSNNTGASSTSSALKDVVVVNKIIGNFLANKVFDTPKHKIALFSALHEAERREVNPLVLEEEDYAVVLSAVLTGKYVVDTGMYYVNVGQPLGRDEFLTLQETRTTSDGHEEYTWCLDTFENAQLFSKEELATIVPSVYRQADFILMEHVARELWGEEK